MKLYKSINNDLEELHMIINDVVNSPTGENTDILQVVLDILTYLPLHRNASVDDIVKLHSTAMWAQSLADDSNFKLIPLYTDDTIESIQITKPSKGLYNNSLTSEILYKEIDSDIFNIINNINENVNIIDYDLLSNILDNEDNNIHKLFRTVKSKNEFISQHGITELLLNNPMFKIDTNSTSNSFYKMYNQTLESTNNMNPMAYNNIIQVPTPEFPYYITKKPFAILKELNTEPVAQSNFTISDDYNIMVYKDRIIIMTNSSYMSNCTYYEYELPSLKLKNTGNDLRLSIFKKLKLFRKGMIGPNVYCDIIPEQVLNLDKCKIQHGFRIKYGKVFDIYNQSKNYKSLNLMYKRKPVGDSYLAIYY